MWKKKFKIELIKKIAKTKDERKSMTRSLCNNLRKIKTDILTIGTDYKSKKFIMNGLLNKRILSYQIKLSKKIVYFTI